jgi:integrase
MATVSFELKSRLKTDGTKQVLIRISNGNEKRRISTKISVPPKHFNPKAKSGQWVRRSYPYHEELNEALLKEIEKVSSVKNPSLFNVGLISFAQKINNRYKDTKSEGYFLRFKSRINKLETFIKPHNDIPIRNVNLSFIEDFNAWLNQRGLKQTSIAGDLKILKTIIKTAIKEGIYTDRDPFLLFKIKQGEPERRALTNEELKKFIEYQPRTKRMIQVKDIFLFQYYSSGTRIGDTLTLKAENIQGDTIRYKARKTGKETITALPDQALEILKKYKVKSGYVFPFIANNETNIFKAIKDKTAYINGVLKDISNELNITQISTHMSRHTFAMTAVRAGASTYELKELLNHSSSAVTDNYVKSIVLDDKRTSVNKIFGKS